MQRYTTYMRKIVGSNQVEQLPFGVEHYREAGIGFAPLAGMPLLEAHTLINRWNSSQFQTRFVYYLN